MRKIQRGGIILFIFIGFILAGSNTTGEGLLRNPILSDSASSGTNLNVDVDFGKIPLYFIHNRGQVDKQARFYARASRYTLWLTEKGLVFDSVRPIQAKEQKDLTRNDQKWPYLTKDPIDRSTRYQREVTRMVFMGANPHPRMVPIEEQELKVNFFRGNDPNKWNCDVPTSRGVIYQDIYPDIDLKVYGIEKELEYDWVVKPGAHPEDIRFEYRNVNSTRFDREGNLVVETTFGDMIHRKPVSYQPDDRDTGKTASDVSIRSKVDVTFKKYIENIYGFGVGEYDKTRELIIDPLVIIYYRGLSANDWTRGYSIAVDSSGYIYLTGFTRGTNFPTINEYMTEPWDFVYGDPFHTYDDAFVTKIDPSQSPHLVYSTYLGGNANDYGNGIAVDNSGNAYVTGCTASTDFPTKNQYQGDQTGTDAFITKIDTTQSGSASLIYSTYLGGASHDVGNGIAVDSSGKAFITGNTDSTDFPTKNQYQGDQTGTDAFITKIDTTQSGSASLIYSTYLGGTSSDHSNDIAVDSSGNTYVTGDTDSANFPVLNQYQGDQTGTDAFVTKIDPNQSGSSSLVYSTYLGGNDDDNGYGITVDNSGNAYVTGGTTSTNFPIINQYQGNQTGQDAFVTKLDTTQSGPACLVYSTYLGGSESDCGSGIALDTSGKTYIGGSTVSTDFPILDEYMSDPGDYWYGNDAFVTKIDTSQSGLSSLIYSTYLGGEYSDNCSDIAVDSTWWSGSAIVTGSIYLTYPPYEIVWDYDLYSAFVYKIGMAETIEITSPNGGETWDAGTSHNITWTSAGPTANVSIEYSPNNGTHWITVIASTPNDGSHTWTVPNNPSTQCLVRISDTADGTPSDTSDAVFTINPGVIESVTVTSPNGGECWNGGSSHTIHWTSSGTFANVKIEYTINNGSYWFTEAASTPNDGSYDWILPVTDSTQCRVRISDASDGIPVDTSDGLFAIMGMVPSGKYRGMVCLDADGNGTDEVFCDFAANGLWMYHGGVWTKLNSMNPDWILSFSYFGKDHLLVDFGFSGLWYWYHNGTWAGTWVKLSDGNAGFGFAVDDDGDGHDEVHLDFMSQGLWRYDMGSTPPFTKLNSTSPSANSLRTTLWNPNQDQGTFSFESLGLWSVWGSPPNWKKLNGSSPEADNLSVECGVGDLSHELIVDFGAAGLWLYDGLSWHKLNSSTPLEIRGAYFPSDADHEIVCSFGGVAGLWCWNYTGGYPGAWTKLTATTPDWDGAFCEPFDPDNDGWEELGVDFGSLGLWRYEHTGGTWLKLTGLNPRHMVRADYQGMGNNTCLVIDFGPGVGLWLYNGMTSSWTKLSSSSPDGVY